MGRRWPLRPRRLALGLLCACLGLVGCGREPDLPRLLREFLQGGPGPGTWEVQGVSTRRTTWIAPHPEQSGWLLKAEAQGGDGAVRPCVVLRSTVAREFLEGPWELFARNYVPQGPAEQTTTRGGEPALRLKWVPRHPSGDTARWVWFHARDGRVVQLEDLAVQGQRVRGLYHVSDGLGGLDPDGVHPGGAGGQDLCVQSPPEVLTLSGLLARAPFAIVAPSYLPPGYERVAARLEELPRADARSGEPVRLASLLFSDGLGLISIGIAVRADMDALQERVGRAMSDDDVAGGCSTLPPEVGLVAVAEGRVLRRRTDLCRTVLRLDGLEGVSVTLLSRNELPGDEYVKVMESLARVTAP